MFEIIWKSLRGFLKNKGRTFLTLLGISVGVAAVVITMGISNLGKQALGEEIDSLGMGGLAISLNDNDAPLTVSELNKIEEIASVKSAMPLVFETSTIYFHNQTLPVCLFGIDRNAESAISLKLLNGRFFNIGDIASCSKVCMVDSKFAAANYGTQNIIGKKITINNGGNTDKYEIIGIIKTGSGLIQNVMGSVIPDFVYIPYSTMQKNMSNNNFTQIVIKTSDDESYEVLSEEVVEKIERSNNYKNAYNVNNLAKQKDSLDGIIDIFSLVLSAIGAVSLIVAGMNIMNVMLVSVKERTREIGIKKAIGAKSSMIAAEFLAESAMISLCGGLLGIIIGNAVMYIGGAILGLTIVPQVDIIFIMILFSAVIGAIFGIYPALKASKLKPVEALRYY